MKTLSLHAEVGADGKLRLEVPCGLPPGPVEVVVIVQPIPPPTGGGPHDTLEGTWSGLVPADFDVEAALKEIRREWEKELDELV
jgi:hypothetical protein